MGKPKRRNRPPVSSNFKPHPMPPKTEPDIQAVVQEAVSAALTKALALPPGATATAFNAQQLQAMQMRNQYAASSASLDRDPYSGSVMFGPGVPLQPAAIDPPMASGRPAPRRFEFPSSVNLQITDNRRVQWSVLREVADNVPIVRSCIETCKAAITGLDWSFGVDSSKARALAKKSDTSSHQVVVDLQDKFADDIERLHAWWQKPDRHSNWTFTQWLNAVLEDELVYDAVALYPHLTMKGGLHSLEVIDSSTIKPLLDHRGATPQPPLAAYQQILYGFPRGEYDQAGTPIDQVNAQFVSAIYGPVKGVHAKTDGLIYEVRNRRSKTSYGFSCVEQALPAVDLWMKRWNWLSAEFDAGVIPQMLVNVDASWTAEQMREWQSILNDALSGNTQERHRALFMPQGLDATYPEGFDAKYSSDLDMQLIKLVCADFGILPTSLGFMPTGRGGSGGGSSGSSSGRSMQMQQDAQLERSTKPRAQWVTDIINEISINYLGMPPEITFTLHGLDDQDEQKQATLIEGYIGSALMTPNEGRDVLNLPRAAYPQANELLFLTPTGPAFLDSSVQPVAMPGNLPSAVQNQPGFKPELESAKPDADPEPDDEPRDEQVQDVPGEAKKSAEQKVFLAFVAKADGPVDRPFAFQHHGSAVASAANQFAAKADLGAIQELFKLVNSGVF